MQPRVTQADVIRLLSNPASRETQEARGLFLALLRLRDGLDMLGVTALFARLTERAERRRAAAELHAMSDRELADIGLTRRDIDASVEAEMPAKQPASRRPTIVLTRPARAAALAA